MNIVIANRLATLRKQNGFSQEELAAKLGISRQAVSKWERAESSPDTNNLIALAELYRISLDALLQSDEESIQNERFAVQAQAESNKDQTSTYDTEFFRYTSKWKRFPFPLLITIIYLMAGWICNWWHPGWILFLTIPIYYAWRVRARTISSRPYARHVS